MMRRAGILVVAILVLVLVGCGKIKYPELPNDAIAFEMGEYIDKGVENSQQQFIAHFMNRVAQVRRKIRCLKNEFFSVIRKFAFNGIFCSEFNGVITTFTFEIVIFGGSDDS